MKETQSNELTQIEAQAVASESEAKQIEKIVNAVSYMIVAFGFGIGMAIFAVINHSYAGGIFTGMFFALSSVQGGKVTRYILTR